MLKAFPSVSLALRSSVTFGSLSLIGLIVGFACVLLPIGVPFAFLGLAGLVLLWTMPDLQSAPVRLARLTLTPMLFGAVCVPYYLAIVIPGVPFISIRRALLFTFVAALVLTLAASSSVRASLIERVKSVPWLGRSTFGYLALILFTVPLSLAPAGSLAAVIGVAMGWYLPLIATILFIDNDARCVGMLRFMLICMCFMFAIGAVEFYLQKPFLWQILPFATRQYLLTYNPMFVGLENGSFRGTQYRGLSTYTVGQSWAEMIAMMMPIAAYFITHGRTAADRRFGVFCVIAGVASLLFSGSRGGYVCSLIAIGLYVMLWAMRKLRYQPESFIPKLTLIVCGAGVICVAGLIAFVPKFHIMVFGNGATQLSDQSRVYEWANAWPRIYERPIFGHGLGTAGQVVNYVSSTGAATIDDYRINLLVDSGGLGLAFYFGLLIVAGILGCKTYLTSKASGSELGACISCSIAAYMIDCTTCSQTDNNSFLFVLVGLVFTLYRVTSKEPINSARTQRTKLPSAFSIAYQTR